MKKSTFKLGSFTGIGIYVHWTMSLLLGGVFVFYLYQGASVGGALAGLVVVGVLFGCVILHELGHALTAKHFGIPTLDITMYPIGGVARLESMPKEPRQELLIAIAGPAVNLAIAAVLFVVVIATGRPLTPSPFVEAEPNVLGMLMWMNLALVGFNMLPAFPMDGGRVLRAGLATKLSYKNATRIASYVGQGMACLFCFFAVWSFNPVLFFVGIFVFLAARQEAEMVLQEQE
ncbi:MAG: site-2 protease family protein [Rhodothermales bacterium]